MTDRFRTSLASSDTLESLRYATKLEIGNIARLALAVSIRKSGRNVKTSTDSSGKDIRRRTLFGDHGDEEVFRAMIQCVHNKQFKDDDEFISGRSYVKNHVDDGCLLLKNLFERCNKNPSLFFQALVKEIDMSPSVIGHSKVEHASFPALDLTIGTDLSNHAPVLLSWNDTAKHANQMMAMVGKPGCGKTQFLTKVLSDIRVQSKYQTNFIFLDYKGDVFNNQKFLQVTRAKVFNVTKEQLPINPFVIPEYSDTAIGLSAEEKAESFASIDSKIGSVQKGLLSRAIRRAYANRTGDPKAYPDFLEVYDELRKVYEEEGKKADSLIEAVRRLTEFNLFWSHTSNYLINEISKETFVVTLHQLPVLKEMVSYLIIERLYKEMAHFDDSPVINGRRVIKTVLVIDEAHNYLSQKNPFLQKIIREGRSKGIAVFFASQSPQDFNRKEFDFKELLEFMFLFQCDGVSPAQVQELLGCSQQTAKKVCSELSRLAPGQVMTKGFNGGELLHFEADAFRLHYAN